MDPGLLEGALTRPDLSLQARFQQYSEIAETVLIPGEEINTSTWEALGRPYILLVGNNNINLGALTLKPQDYQSIGGLVIPGKSALLDFEGLHALAKPIAEISVGKDVINLVKTATMGKDSNRFDNLWVATLDEIHNAGFKIFYAPVRTNKLHVRIIWGEHTNLEFPFMGELPIVPEENILKLIEAFKRIMKI